ncbi:Homoserine/homoserine lactone efflux protein [Paraburkholderia domus]|uniref:Homoserine/homoserine lactone efflux protein n=1 Tax=Paraburkholderia domus TaxID=2793075 RepID=A0A9N8N5S0_9BURK|nr:LysE family translocator [Paraburkholderia domus]MBK5053516.1 LysE family translocator [Burkholderia sp. R-70006]MBK5063908.1 LysE family translocator [Burkholderia sp. R-70199]MBK5090318.1 LysE family translocator [Burkholderia sp. R-69927]MBK5124874.1 LysE family translocator [Burkholderia sp. R-69980]MBK5169250.1 LysE family translocator [Burkholderia sp. R-70211]MBK5185976.1 LysE family translocator [Burkholderia sp. R-69749]MCI0148779.1 LysE family transporter [Paraburkholderia sedim
MSLSALLVFALALIIAAGTPGPSIAALVARVLTNGFRDVLPFLAAMWLGEALWLTCAVAGLAVIARSFGMVFIALKFVGVAYLLFLAWKMWRAPADVQGSDLPSGQSPWRMFVAGLLVTLGNPKIMMFYLALLPTIIDLSRIGTVAWFELTLTMLIVLMAVDFGWALLATRARKLLSTRRAVRITNRASATVMAGVAAAIATR